MVKNCSKPCTRRFSKGALMVQNHPKKKLDSIYLFIKKETLKSINYKIGNIS